MPAPRAFSAAVLLATAAVLAPTMARAGSPKLILTKPLGAAPARPAVAPPPPELPVLTPVRPVQPPLPMTKPAAGAQPVIQRTAMQAPVPFGVADGGDESQDYRIQLEPPGKNQLFILETEAQLFERMKQEALQRPVPERIYFPEEPVLDAVYAGRTFPPSYELVEPFYLCYGRLLFHQPNSERWGWDLGIIQPFVSAGTFFKDVACLPYKLGSYWCHPYECNTGLCLPGDPVPYRLYPCGLSFTGSLTQAAVMIAIFAVFP